MLVIFRSTTCPNPHSNRCLASKLSAIWDIGLGWQLWNQWGCPTTYVTIYQSKKSDWRIYNSQSFKDTIMLFREVTTAKSNHHCTLNLHKVWNSRRVLTIAQFYQRSYNNPNRIRLATNCRSRNIRQDSNIKNSKPLSRPITIEISYGESLILINKCYTSLNSTSIKSEYSSGKAITRGSLKVLSIEDRGIKSLIKYSRLLSYGLK